MLPSGTEVVARYNFFAKSQEDLSFTKGDIMTIVAGTPVSGEGCLPYFQFEQ